MLLKYDTDKLERAMYDFNKATGVSITLYDCDKNPVTSMGAGSCEYCASVIQIKEMKHSCIHSNNELLDRCKKSRKMEKHICRAGLLDIVIPLVHHGEIVGYLMIGQIKQNAQFPCNLSGFGEASPLLKEKYDLIPLADEEKISSIISIGTMLTSYIMLENMVHSRPARTSAVIEAYVDEHLGERISVELLAQKTHISISGIYKSIRQSHGCTPGEFICAKRLRVAVKMLVESEMLISEIAEATGFVDAAHFSKSFKKAYGVSPLKYRKNAQNCNA